MYLPHLELKKLAIWKHQKIRDKIIIIMIIPKKSLLSLAKGPGKGQANKRENFLDGDSSSQPPQERAQPHAHRTQSGSSLDVHPLPAVVSCPSTTAGMVSEKASREEGFSSLHQVTESFYQLEGVLRKVPKAISRPRWFH